MISETLLIPFVMGRTFYKFPRFPTSLDFETLSNFRKVSTIAVTSENQVTNKETVKQTLFQFILFLNLSVALQRSGGGSRGKRKASAGGAPRVAK